MKNNYELKEEKVFILIYTSVEKLAIPNPSHACSVGGVLSI